MRFKIRKQIDPPEINLTPLIDVVFVILILFIVIAPLLEKEEIALAEAGAQAIPFKETEEEIFSIEIDANNSVSINKMGLALQELPSILHIVKQTHPLAEPRVFCDEKACFGNYQKVKNALEEAGYEKMELILKPHA